MALSSEERSEILERLAWLEAQAHRHPDGRSQQPPTSDQDLLRRLARLQAEVDTRRAGGSS